MLQLLLLLLSMSSDINVIVVGATHGYCDSVTSYNGVATRTLLTNPSDRLVMS